MKSTLALAALGIVFLAAHPRATSVNLPVPGRVPTAAFMQAARQNADNSVWTGRWQGTTISGQPLVLQLQADGQRLTGKLTVGKQSANIVEGKIVGVAFALRTDKIDGHRVDGTGRRVGDALEFTIEGVKEPLMLTRVP